MAGVGFAAVAVNAVTGTSTKTVLQVKAGAAQAILIKEWSVSFQGVSNTAAPIEVALSRQSTAGTSVGLTVVKAPDDSDEALTTTALETFSSTEPTTGDNLMTELVHPQTGYTWQAPFGREIKVGSGDRLAIIVITPGATVSCVARMIGEE